MKRVVFIQFRTKNDVGIKLKKLEKPRHYQLLGWAVGCGEPHIQLKLSQRDPNLGFVCPLGWDS